MADLFKTISNFTGDLGPGLADLTGAANTSGKGNTEPPRLPWNNGSQAAAIHSTKNEVFFPPSTIDPERWNRLYPYRLLVVDVANGNKVVSGPSGGGSIASSYFLENPASGIDYIVSQEQTENVWAMALPITPQQLQITDQFAINTSATMRGIVEEHNGVKFKMITATGTTGVWPLKPTVGDNISRPDVVGSILGGTLQNLGNVTEQLKRTKSAFDGNHPNKQGPTQKPGETGFGHKGSTGYYQALYLGQFLERYAQAKKNPAFKNWRLVLDMPKQNQSFVVTPQQFTLSQSEQKPNEYIYTMQFKAWKRIELNQAVEPAPAELPNLGDPNLYQRVVNTIEQTRRTLGASLNLVKAVRSDFQGVFNNLRQVSLIAKDAGGLVFSVAELPRQIVSDLASAIEDTVINTFDAFTPPTDRFRDQAGVAGAVNKFLDTGGLSASGKAGSIAQSISNQRKVNEGLSRDQVKSGALGRDAAEQTEVDTLNNVYENPEANFDFFNTINLEDVQLTQEQEAKIEDEIQIARLTTIDDLRDVRADLIALSNEIADNYGASDETYARIYGLPDPKERPLALTVEENEVLDSIEEAIQALDLLTATKQFDDLNTENPLEFVGGLANESGIDFENFPSKTLAPVPFGLTIEEIAARYMGDASKWLEIVTVNKLRSPYIDEEGFVYNFLSNAEGRQFTVDDSEEKLFIGQKITMVSDTVPAFSRKITNVEKIGDNNFLVTVDGEANLDQLSTSDNARMQGYLPGTVNSQNQIFIPSNDPADEDDRTFDVFGVSDNRLAKLSKVDFLLTDNYDIAINSVGDFRLATGLNNLIQALKLKIRTKKGSLLNHLEYGLGLQHGVSVADVQSGAIIEDLNKMIDEDPRFQSITKVTLTLRGSTLDISMVVQLANQTGVLPIDFDVKVA